VTAEKYRDIFPITLVCTYFALNLRSIDVIGFEMNIKSVGRINN